MEEWQIVFASTLQATIRVSVPLLLCALAGIFSERSGVVDIGLEGKLLFGAFAAAAVAYLSQNVLLGMLAAIWVCIALSLLHGFAVITHRGDQIISGLAVNLLSAGLTVVLGIALFKQGGSSPSLTAAMRFTPIHFTGLAESNISWLAMLGKVLEGHNLLTYLSYLIILPFAAWVIYHTKFGLHLRATGENPQAVDSVGISVYAIRYQALVINGILTGIAGAYLSTALNAGFVRGMSAGLGFIALAAMIFGKWRPYPALWACLMFGFFDVLSVRLQGVDLPILGVVPVQFVQVLPYLLTVLVLAGLVGAAIAPKTIAQPYVKEH